MTVPTASDLIKKYIELRDATERITDRYNKEVQPYKEGLELIENLLTEEINRLDGQAIKTQHGTAYRSTVTSFRVIDRETWLNWVINENKRDMLTTNVAKDAVKDYIEATSTTPPGLSTTSIFKTNVRRPD